MGIYTFKLPDIGEGIAEAEIAEWKIAVGDVVAEDQGIVDMLTDKAAVEIESPVGGTVKELCGEAGSMIAVGGPLVRIEVEGDGNTDVEEADDGESVKTASRTAPADPETPVQIPTPAPQPAPTPAATTAQATSPSPPPRQATSGGLPRKAGEKPLASPAVRRRAQSLGIRLEYVPGSGPAGRITQQDLDAFVQGNQGAASPGASRAAKPGVEEIRIIGLRRRIATAMQQAKQRIPHFAYVEEVDVTELEALRQHLNAKRRDDQAKLTMLPFLARALVIAVPEHPQVNARFDDEADVLHRYDALHIGIATQTPGGLVVPVMQHAEAKSLWDMAADIRRLAEAARSGKASREELTGSTLTITSLGAMGGIASTPVINAPEVGIIGVNKMVQRPMYINGQLTPRLMMNLSSSFDHRIVDGWDAAALIQRIKGLLEHPATLFMEGEA
ncbi:MAG: dihydrolipoamide acetyltransferase family protein [Abyssibacter sp.]|uniref:dihydrolipoamide acetyltransferase family protein n=1 Tax=Abyssibacter sp. TaxID=2320200 RepID=UPI00321AB01B